MSKRIFTKEYLLEKLILLSESKNSIYISKEDIESCIFTPSVSSYRRYFGSLEKALEIIGLKHGKITGRPQNPPILLSKKVMEIINGELLGDGHLSSSGSNSCFQHSTANIEYGKYLYCKLLEENVPLVCGKIIPGRNNGKPQFHTRTSCNITFSNLRSLWYENKIKIIPKDMLLTRETCLHWFLGDGYFNKHKTIFLYTCCFKEQELQMLISEFNKINIISSINFIKGNPVIRISNKSTVDFFNFIGPCPVLGYEYKWGIGEWIDKNKSTNNLT